MRVDGALGHPGHGRQLFHPGRVDPLVREQLRRRREDPLPGTPATPPARGRIKTLVHTESSDQKTAVVDTVLAVAEETGASPAQVSVAWLRERAARATTSYVPIIGPRNTAQLEDYLGALEVDLSEEQYNRLTEVSAVPLGVPHEASAAVRDTVQGGDASVVTGPAVPVA
ncbi:aldo/keto reductase [Streptomyces sp. PmtA]|uniref:aldo/keto reductase n=1 Tax=Streptomyces sp. PmtA TaxID=3074275 RepID=UPI0030152C33